MESAIATGKIDLVRDIITKDIKEVSAVYGTENETPLHQACLGQNFEICQILLENNADPSAIDKAGNTPLHALVVSPEAEAPEARNKIMEILVKHGASVNTVNKEGKTPAHLAAFRGFGNTLILLSNQGDCDLDKTDNNGLSPIIIAARNNRQDCVKVLLGLHADTTILMKDVSTGKIPEDTVKIIDKRKASGDFGVAIAQYQGKQIQLYNAIRSNNKNEVSRLLKKDKSLAKRRGPSDCTILHVAAFFGHEEVCQYLIEKHKFLLTALDAQQLTPLLVAAKEVRLRACECLLRNKADPCASDSRKWTALHYLASMQCNDPIGYHKLYTLLTACGTPLEASDIHGNTAMHVAAENGIEQAIVYLKPLGANIHAKNDDGKMPIQLAARSNLANIVGIMIGLGSDVTALQNDYKLNLLPKDVRERFASKLEARKQKGHKSGYLSLKGTGSHSELRPGSHENPNRRAARSSVSIGGEEHQLIIIDQMNQIISSGGDLNRFLKKEYRSFITKFGSTGRAPIHMAAMEGNTSAMSLLLSQENSDVNQMDAVGRTPLLSACKFGRLNIVEMLLECAEIDARICSRVNNRSALHYLASFPIADVKRVITVTKGLIEHGLDVNATTMKQRYWPAHYAAMSGNAKTISVLHFFGSDLTQACLNGMTPIQMAARDDNVDNVRELLERGACKADLIEGVADHSFSQDISELLDTLDIPETPKREILVPESELPITPEAFVPQDHPIHEFILSKPKPAELARFLKKEGNANALHIPNLEGKTSVHLLSAHGIHELIPLLAGKYELPLDRIDGEGDTCLHIAASRGLVKTCEVLLENAANPMINNSTGTLLHTLSVVSEGVPNCKELVTNLVGRKLQVNSLNAAGLAPLHIAAITGNNSMISALLENKAELDIQSTEGKTPLYYAMANRRKSAVRLLRSRGASIDWLTPELEEGMTAAIMDVIKIVDPRNQNSTSTQSSSAPNIPTNVSEIVEDPIQKFHSLTVTGNKQELRKLLKKNPKLLFSKDHEGSSVLHIAAFLQNQDLVSFFIEKKLDPNVVNSKGYAPLIIAAKAGNLTMCEFLMSHGTDPRVSTEGGFSALHFLAARKFDLKEEKLLQKVIKLFTEQGASINQKNRNFDTPLHLACSCGNDIVVSALLALKVNCEGLNSLGNTPLLCAICAGYPSTVLLLLESTVDSTMLQQPQIHRSLPKLSTEMMKVLATHKIIIPAEPGTRERAAASLKHCEGLIEAAYLESSSKAKEEKRKLSVRLDSLTPDPIISPPCITLKSCTLISNDITDKWKKAFKQCCQSALRGTPRSKVSRIDADGLKLFFDLLHVPVQSTDLSPALHQISMTGLITFKEFLGAYGPVLILFAAEIDDIEIEEQEIQEKLFVPEDRVRPASIGGSLPPPINSLSDPKGDGQIRKLSTPEKIILPRSQKPGPPPSPTPSPSRIDVSRAQSDTGVNSTSPKSARKEQQNSRAQSDADTINATSPKSARKEKDSPRSRSRSTSDRPTFISQLTKSLTGSQPSRRQSKGSKTEILPPTPECSSEESSRDISEQTLLEFADAMTHVDTISPNSSAYQFFGQLYDRLVSQEKQELLSISVFEEYFKDSFTSYNLLHTIVPTLMAQKDLEIPGITREAFCEFFLGQKIKSLSRSLEVANRLRGQLSLSLKETISAYNHYSSVERFKARMYLQQLSKLFGSMEQSLADTHSSFLKTRAHETNVLNDFDEAIIELQSNMLEVHDTLNKLYAPRKIESDEMKDNKISDAFKQGLSPSRNVILIIRNIEANGNVAELRNLLDSYTVRSSLVDGCTHSYVKFAEPAKFKICQTWTSVTALEEFLLCETHLEYISSTEPLKRSEDVVVNKIS